jgi:biopolymer transport protein ExbD
MLKRPSSRRRSEHAEVNINLVPMLDALVTMISFLMFTMAFLSVTSIDSPLPLFKSDEKIEQPKTTPLQLTLNITPTGLELYSPFNKIPKIVIPNKPDAEGKPNMPDYEELHRNVVSIRAKFPEENKIIFMPSSSTNYDVLIRLSDKVKNLEKTDEPIGVKNPTTGVTEEAKSIYEEIVFGNLLGD